MKAIFKTLWTVTRWKTTVFFCFMLKNNIQEHQGQEKRRRREEEENFVEIDLCGATIFGSRQLQFGSRNLIETINLNSIIYLFLIPFLVEFELFALLPLELIWRGETQERASLRSVEIRASQHVIYNAVCGSFGGDLTKKEP